MADNNKDRRPQGTPHGDQQRQRTGHEPGAGQGQGQKGGVPGKPQPGAGGGKAPMGGGKAPMGGGKAPTSGGKAPMSGDKAPAGGGFAKDMDDEELGGESGDVVIELDDEDRITQRNPAQREPERR